MRSEVINCDVCGVSKGEGNKWLLGWVSAHGYALGDWNSDFQKLNGDLASHFCSEACALKHQARYLRRVA